MSEMIFGNTGRNDEPINIDMAENLYKKLQTRNYVSTLKSMLAVGMDKSFVFLGDVDGYSIYGYNSRLENDNRGGNYGHYIAEKLGEKTADFKIDNEQFLTEKGFNECVQQKKSNDRFTVKLQPVEFNENAKKRLVHNFVEMFSNRGRKRNISFSIDDNDIDSFNAKSIFVFSELIKYLPYQIRKNIGFISHISSRERLPEYINIVGYSISATYKPHDCIDISDDTPIKNDCRFYDYVETVFAMDDGARKAYFDMLYENIEKYAPVKNSDMYDLDLKTRPFWENGDEKKAVEDIFNSEEKILKVYPAFIEIARTRFASSWKTVLEYTEKKIGSVKYVNELKNEYQKNCSFWELWKIDFPDDIKKQFKEQSNKFISDSAANEDKFIQTVDEIISINNDIIDKEHLTMTVKDIIKNKSDIFSICGFLEKLDKYFAKDEQILDAEKIEKAVVERVSEITDKATKSIKNSCEKLNKFIELYPKEMPKCIKDVYDEFYNNFNSDANLKVDKVLPKLEEYKEAIEKLKTSGKPLVHLNYELYKECFNNLAEIAYCDDKDRKRRIEKICEFFMQRFSRYLDNNAVYEKYKEVDDNIYSNIQTINYSGCLKDDETIKKVCAFHVYNHDIMNCVKMRDAIKYYEDNPRSKCDITADEFLSHWLEENAPSKSKLTKALKECDKQTKMYEIINDYKEKKFGNSDNKLSIPEICFLVLLSLLLIAVGAFGGIKIYEMRVVNDLNTQIEEKQNEIQDLQTQLEVYKNPQPEAENEEKQKQEQKQEQEKTESAPSAKPSTSPTSPAPKTSQNTEKSSTSTEGTQNSRS